jgi:uncharacterized protein DUF6632
MSATPTDPGSRSTAERLLPIFIRATAVIFVVFFTLAFIGSAAQVSTPEFVYRLVGWGSVGDAEEQMISIVYIVWGIFLWLAASDPLRHRLFLDFTIAANAAHFLLMGIQAIVMEGEHIHLVGDVLFGWLIVIALAAVWLPVRKRAV